MARFIIATQDDPESKELGKLLTSKLRASGNITLSLPPRMEQDQQVGWVNMTGYSSDTGDKLVSLALKTEGKKTGTIGWYADSEGKDLAKRIATKLSDAADIPLLTLQPEDKSSDKKIPLISETRPVAIAIEIINLDGVDAGKIAEQIKISLITEPEPETDDANSTDNSSVKPAQDLNQPATRPSPFSQGSKTPQVGSTTPNNTPASTGSFAPPASGNGFGAPPSSQGFGTTTGFGTGSASGFSGDNMSRDERKKMIEKYYKMAFGKDPDQGDVNYFLNIGVSGEQLLKRILESEDHLKLVKNSLKYDELKKEYDETKTKAEKLEDQLKDQRKVLESLNSLLLQKNYALQQLSKRYRLLSERSESYFKKEKSSGKQIEYKGSFSDRFFEFFSRLLS